MSPTQYTDCLHRLHLLNSEFSAKLLTRIKSMHSMHWNVINPGTDFAR